MWRQLIRPTLPVQVIIPTADELRCRQGYDASPAGFV